MAHPTFCASDMAIMLWISRGSWSNKGRLMSRNTPLSAAINVKVRHVESRRRHSTRSTPVPRVTSGCASIARTMLDAVHFFAPLGDIGEARYHSSEDGVSSPGGQQLHRTVPSQLEGRRSLDDGVSQLGRSTGQHRSLDRGVQSRPASSRSPKSHTARDVLGSCSSN
jgi:hypothetical protein